MEYLGRSLESHFKKLNYNFSLKTVTLIGEQMIDRIQYIHSKGFIHRDIKPENFITGINNNEKILYLIDFGLAKRYKSKNGLHIPYRDGKNLTGTLRYASCNTHLGIEQSRRDDIESIGYCLLYFLKKKLPWMGIKAKNNKERFKKIMDVKIKTKLEIICDGLPKEFAIIVQYSRDLRFDEKPNYQALKKLLRKVGDENCFNFDGMFDWISNKNNNYKIDNYITNNTKSDNNHDNYKDNDKDEDNDNDNDNDNKNDNGNDNNSTENNDNKIENNNNNKKDNNYEEKDDLKFDENLILKENDFL